MAALMGVAVVAGSGAALAQTSSTPAAQQSQKVHGSVVSVQGDTMTFKADDGRTLTADMKTVSPRVRQALKANEGATLIGSTGSRLDSKKNVDTKNLEARFIQKDSSAAAKTTK